MKHKELITQKMSIEGKEMEFSLARSLAEGLASSSISEPMFIAWYDGIKGDEHPHVPECQHKPGWLAYAEGYGGRIRIDVNGGEFSFVFADAGEPMETSL